MMFRNVLRFGAGVALVGLLLAGCAGTEVTLHTSGTNAGVVAPPDWIRGEWIRDADLVIQNNFTTTHYGVRNLRFAEGEIIFTDDTGGSFSLADRFVDGVTELVGDDRYTVVGRNGEVETRLRWSRDSADYVIFVGWSNVRGDCQTCKVVGVGYLRADSSS